ncbi:class I adenylate-forming enzyme family protein [Plantactinospora sp. GCM10030261]|uniref:class I adenylate-forming enzyme family protein n=1 Tax=Plantactinospora sp. GCM10030261 TaxID=3273420 RepID=UPI003611196C
MLTVLRHARPAGTPAIRAYAAGGWVDTSWAALTDAAASVADRARTLRRDVPVIVVLDGTAASVATVLGLVDAGVDVLLLEERTSQLADPRSPVYALGAPVIVGPARTLDESVPDGAVHGGPARLTYEAFRDSPSAAAIGAAAGVPVPARPGEILQLTSGSTGRPRIARQTLDNVLAGARAYRDLFEITAADVVLVAVPVAHSYGLAGTFAALISGATLVTLPRFGIRALVAGLEQGATVLLGTPLLYRLLAPVLAARLRPTRVRTALSAGGPLGAEAGARIGAALGAPVRQIYGITEAGLVACVPQALTDWPAGSVGFAAPGVTLRIDGPDASGAADADRTGRLLVRTPALFLGYRGEERRGLTADGYYDTGDLVRLDRTGHLFVLGRNDSFVNVGGRKVNPRRTEQVLADHPGVREVVVYGAERSDGEQEIHAAVVLDPATTPGEVLAHCRAAALLPYETPHHLHVLNRLPRSGLGKVDRQRLLALVGQPAPGRPDTSTTDTHTPTWG